MHSESFSKVNKRSLKQHQNGVLSQEWDHACIQPPTGMAAESKALVQVGKFLSTAVGAVPQGLNWTGAFPWPLLSYLVAKSATTVLPSTPQMYFRVLLCPLHPSIIPFVYPSQVMLPQVSQVQAGLLLNFSLNSTCRSFFLFNFTWPPNPPFPPSSSPPQKPELLCGLTAFPGSPYSSLMFPPRCSLSKSFACLIPYWHWLLRGLDKHAILISPR